MEIKISDIKVKKRIREEIGDLKPLMESLEKHGLFHPVLVTEKLELISGFRRLSSAKELGWDYIDAKIISIKSKTEFIERELDENILRKDFTPDEITSGYEQLKRLKNPGFFRRLFRSIKNFFLNLFSKKSSF